MRTIAALALMFSAASAFACPNLAGSFTCNYNGQKEVITVTQSMKGAVTVYMVNGSEIVADNQVRNIPDDESLKNATFRAWCDDTVTLKGQILGKYYNNGSYFGDLTADINFLLANGNLKQVTTGELKGANGNYPINNETVCTKN